MFFWAFLLHDTCEQLLLRLQVFLSLLSINYFWLQCYSPEDCTTILNNGYNLQEIVPPRLTFPDFGEQLQNAISMSVSPRLCYIEVRFL